MISFLKKLSKFESLQDIVLLSGDGEPLYVTLADGDQNQEEKLTLIHDIVRELKGFEQTDLLFTSGCWYLANLRIGTLAVSMLQHDSLPKIRQACERVRNQLRDSAIYRKVLLKMLDEVDLGYRHHVLKELEPLADVEVARSIATLLDHEVAAGGSNAKILCGACQVLAASMSKEAHTTLSRLLDDRDRTANLPAAVLKAAQIALVRLQLDISQESPVKQQHLSGMTDLLPEIGDGVNPIKIAESTRTDPDECRIEKLLVSGNRQEGINQLVRLIEDRAGEKQFRKAEELREWLISIDSMAIREIIHTAEIIEDAKKSSISSETMETWQNLATALGQDEFSALYHAASQRRYKNGEYIVKPGSFLSSLILVNSGQVQIYNLRGGKEVSLRVISAGEILGWENFFEISVWTVGLRSLGADLSLLDWPELRNLKQVYPALQAKLTEHCATLFNPNALFRQGLRSRRNHEREPIRGKILATLLDDLGKSTGVTLKGDIMNISRGGMAFGGRFSRKKNAVIFLGRTIQAEINPDKLPEALRRTGKIMAIHCNDFIGSDYSLHVQFDQELAPQEMTRLLSRQR